MISWLKIFFAILCGISVSSSYRFLAIFPFPGRSHFHVLAPVAKSLAQKGHQVDVISYFRLEEPFPNYTELDFFEAVSHTHVNSNVSSSPDAQKHWAVQLITEVCAFLGHPTVQELIKNLPKKSSYDAVILHIGLGAECVMAAGLAFNVPMIGVVTTMLYAPISQYIGNPLSLSIAPGHTYYFKQNFTFFERVQNFLYSRSQIRTFKSYESVQEQLIKDYLGESSPEYSEVHKHLALLLSNSHYSFYGIKPKTPALVEIGGINIHNETSKISQNLKKILDESPHGFVYFSFGTQTVLETLPNNFLNIIFSTFCKISPIRVIMRIPNPDVIPENLCKNILTEQWLPQQRILEHPNIKAFVTHGGGLSTQETIHHAVPVICMPIASEQHINCDIFVLKNMGIKIDMENDGQKDYEDAFQKILSDSKYKNAMKKFSQLYWDRPQSPQEAVTYWVEYVMRHGKNALRSPAIDLEWWEFELIDVYCFIFICFILAISFTIIVAAYALKLVIRSFDFAKKLAPNKKLN